METIDILIATVLILIMFGIGLSLDTKDVKKVFSKPKALIIALASQMLILPLIAFGICIYFDIPIYVKIGLIILASSPGGTTSGFITYLFKGNTALSIILTTINSLLTLISIPIIINLALTYFYGKGTAIHLPIGETMKEIFVLTAIPAAIGVTVRSWNSTIALFISKYAKPILIILLGIVFLLKFMGTNGQPGITKPEIVAILPYALLLNVSCFITGFLLSSLFKLGTKNQITIAVESAVHNTTMAFLISGTLLHNDQYGKVALVYAMFSFWTALLFCYFIKLSPTKMTE